MENSKKRTGINNQFLLLKIMLRYWGYLVTGFIFMLGYSLLSGITITMVIPLFNNVFVPQVKEKIYTTFAQFSNAISSTLSHIMAQSQTIFTLLNSENRQLLLIKLQEVLSVTDPLLLLYIICVVVVIITLTKNIFYYINRILFANLRGKTILSIREVMFEKYLKQSFAFFNVNKVGDSIVRMVSDVEIVSDQLIFPLFNNIMLNLILLSVYAGLAISMNSRLFLFSLIVLPIFSLFLTLLGKKIRKYAKRIQTKFSDMFSTIEEVLNNIRIVKAFSREEKEFQKFEKINRTYFKFWRKSVIYAGINVPLSEISGTLLGVFIIIFGGKLLLTSETAFDLGKFTAFLLAIFSMEHPIKELTKAYADIKRAYVSLDRLFEVLGHKSEIRNSEHPVPKKTFDKNIVFRDVSFSYNDKVTVLKNISFEITKGQKVAFVGSSGSGKTTLINLLPRMYDITTGEILIDDINIKEIDLKDLRMLFGTVTQDSILFSDTVANNIRYGSLEDVSDEIVRESARISYADEFIENLPHQYNEMLHQKGAVLSGGQKQRLCIARAIVSNPPILIFDEATSALDTESEKKVQQAIDQATQNRTVLVIAHRLSTVLSANKIITLDKGRIVGIGTHEELLRFCERYQKLYHLQFQDHINNMASS